MLNKLSKLRESREEGFALVELLVVVIVIGVLSAIAVPLYQKQQQAAIASVVKADVRSTVTAVRTYLIRNPDATTDELQVAKIGTGNTSPINIPNTEVVPVVSSPATTVIVSGDWRTFVVYAHSSEMPFGSGLYMYDSRTGKFGSSETSLYIERGGSGY